MDERNVACGPRLCGCVKITHGDVFFVPPRTVVHYSTLRCETKTNHLSFFFLQKQLFIKTLTGRKQSFNFEPENQVLAVKQALQEKEGIQVDQIRLIFSGKQL